MNRHTIPLGRILGIPIGLDYSWFLIFALLTWTMAVGYYPAEFKNWPVAEYWFMGAVTASMLFVSVLLHEPRGGQPTSLDGRRENSGLAQPGGYYRLPAHPAGIRCLADGSARDAETKE